MALSTILIGMASFAVFFTGVVSSPVAAGSKRTDTLFARQFDIPSCSFVLRADRNTELLDVNLLVHFREVLTQLYTASNPSGITVDTSNPVFQVAYNGDGTWSWTSFNWLLDPVSQEYWTAEAVTDATERLVGFTTETPVTSWTVESAGCSPSLTLAQSDAHNGTRTQEVRQAGPAIIKRQDTRDAVCTYHWRPDEGSDTALAGVELGTEIAHAWFLSMSGNFGPGGTGEVGNLWMSFASLLSHNNNGSWSWAMSPSLLNIDGDYLGVEEVIAKAEALVGDHVLSIGTGWTIESASCTLNE